MRVRIDAHGRQVELEVDDTNVTPDSVAALARILWDHTAGPEPSAAAYGFTTARSAAPSGPAWFRRDQPEVR